MSRIEILVRVLDDNGELENEARIQYLSDHMFQYPEYRAAAFKQAERLLCRKLGLDDETRRSDDAHIPAAGFGMSEF